MRFIVSSGTSIRLRSEYREDPTEALALVRSLLAKRRPNVVVADETGQPISVFHLQQLAVASRARERATGT
jgi:hypothetical protein